MDRHPPTSPRSARAARARGAGLVAAITLGALGVACDDRVAEPPAPRAAPATVNVARGDSQRVAVGTPVGVAPEVLVRDSSDRPVAGVRVTFRVFRGGGTLRDSVATTGADGVARLGSWTLGRRPGWQRVVAEAPGVDHVVQFDALADPGPPAAVRMTTVGPLRGVPGAMIPVPLDLQPVDRFENPVLGNPASAAVPPTPPRITLEPELGDVVTIDSTLAFAGSTALRLRWQLSERPGPRSLVVRVGDVSVTVHASTYVPPYRLAPVSAGEVVGRVLEPMPGIGVRLTDAEGTPMVGVPIEIRVTSGDGAVTRENGIRSTLVQDSGLVEPTGADGIVHNVVWKLGPVTGRQTLRAEAPGLGAATDVVGAAYGSVTYLRATQIGAYGFGTCVLSPDQAAYCWGGGQDGALPRALPAPPFVALGIGGGASCGLTAAGVPYCWGESFFTADQPRQEWPAPTPFAGTPPLRSIAVSAGSACGLTATGTAWCWGPSAGRGPESTWFVPPGPVSGGATFTAIGKPLARLLRDYTCAVRSDGRLLCWGTLPDTGSIRYPTHVEPRTRRLDVPTPLAEGPPLVALAAGDPLCGIAADGAAYCWRDASEPPARVGGALRFRQLAFEERTACGVTLEDELWCWGSNEFGQIGDGTATDRPTPVRVAPPLHFTQVALGEWHTCAIATDAAVYCWGHGVWDQLGDGLTMSRRAPRRVVLRVDP